MVKGLPIQVTNSHVTSKPIGFNASKLSRCVASKQARWT